MHCIDKLIKEGSSFISRIWSREAGSHPPTPVALATRSTYHVTRATPTFHFAWTPLPHAEFFSSPFSLPFRSCRYLLPWATRCKVTSRTKGCLAFQDPTRKKKGESTVAVVAIDVQLRFMVLTLFMLFPFFLNKKQKLLPYPFDSARICMSMGNPLNLKFLASQFQMNRHINRVNSATFLGRFMDTFHG